MAKLMADILMFLHFLWVVFMLVGFPLAIYFKNNRLRLVHILGLTAYIFLAVVDWYCPLTLGEEYFRQMESPGFSYNGSFLAAWVGRLIYVEQWGAPLWIFRVLAGVYLLVCVSSWWWLPKAFFTKGQANEK